MRVGAGPATEDSTNQRIMRLPHHSRVAACGVPGSFRCGQSSQQELEPYHFSPFYDYYIEHPHVANQYKHWIILIQQKTNKSSGAGV